MWNRLMVALGVRDPEPTPEAIALQALQAQMAAAAQAATAKAASAGGAANDDNYSLSGDVVATLEAQLRKAQVTKYGRNGSTRPARFPLHSLSLTSNDISGGRHSLHIRGDDEDDKRPKGERVTLEVVLAGAVEDYEVFELKKAVTQLVGSIPVFAGKIVTKPIETKHPTYRDVGVELKALLAKHPNAFAPEELQTIDQFFAATPNQKDMAPHSRWDSPVTVSHPKGKVFIRLGSRNVIDDDKETTAVESSDAKITDYFKAHRKPLLDMIKQKVAALRKADGTPVVTMEELAALDLHATASGYDIELTLGTRPESLVDPATGKKLTGEQRAEKFTETPLAKVDTNMLEKIFIDSLVETSKPLPPMLEKFVDGDTLGKILCHRIPKNPELEAFINKHDMFLSLAEKKAKEPKATRSDQIELEEPYLSSGRHVEGDTSTRSRLSLSFDLPEGMTLRKLYDHIAMSKNQMGVGAHAANDEGQKLGGRAA
jgi:hypothetical protein